MNMTLSAIFFWKSNRIVHYEMSFVHFVQQIKENLGYYPLGYYPLGYYPLESVFISVFIRKSEIVFFYFLTGRTNIW